MFPDEKGDHSESDSVDNTCCDCPSDEGMDIGNEPPPFFTNENPGLGQTEQSSTLNLDNSDDEVPFGKPKSTSTPGSKNKGAHESWKMPTFRARKPRSRTTSWRESSGQSSRQSS